MGNIKNKFLLLQEDFDMSVALTERLLPSSMFYMHVVSCIMAHCYASLFISQLSSKNSANV